MIVTVLLLFENTGAFASDKGYWTVMSEPLPTQYSGRYMYDWKSFMLVTVKYAPEENGFM